MGAITVLEVGQSRLVEVAKLRDPHPQGEVPPQAGEGATCLSYFFYSVSVRMARSN